MSEYFTAWMSDRSLPENTVLWINLATCSVRLVLTHKICYQD